MERAPKSGKAFLLYVRSSLVVPLLVLVLPGIEPEHGRKPRAGLVPGRQV